MLENYKIKKQTRYFKKGKMNFIVDPKTVERTTCGENFSCLFGDKTKQLCEVEYKLGDKHYISCQHNDFCHHQEQHKGFNQCNCPVRKEIYKNHGI